MEKLGRIHKLGLAGLSALALAAPVALAQTAGGEQGDQTQRHERGEHRGHRGGKRGGEFGRGHGFGFRGVELTDAQKASLKQLRQSFGERTKSLREQLHAKRQELRQAESGTTFNEAVATQKLTEVAALQARLMAEEFKLRQDSLALLTPEQKTQLEQRRQQFEQRRQLRSTPNRPQQQWFGAVAGVNRNRRRAGETLEPAFGALDVRDVVEGDFADGVAGQPKKTEVGQEIALAAQASTHVPRPTAPQQPFPRQQHARVHGGPTMAAW